MFDQISDLSMLMHVFSQQTIGHPAKTIFDGPS